MGMLPEDKLGRKSGAQVAFDRKAYTRYGLED
jgi:hypothetical protein